MQVFLFQLILFAFLCFPIFALKAVHAPTTIEAGTDVQVVIETDAQDPQWEHYRLYLGADDPYYVLYPFCFLSSLRPINETTTTVNIPQDVGPNGSTYRIHAYSGSTFQWSDYITLTGMSLSNWSATEPSGMKLMDAVPCTAMNCDRACEAKNYAAHKNGTWWDNNVYCSCLRKCPGVDTTNPYYGAGDGCGWEWRSEDQSSSQALGSANMQTTSASASSGSPSGSLKPSSADATTTHISPAPSTTGTPGTAATPSPSKAQGSRLQQLHNSAILVFGTVLLL